MSSAARLNIGTLPAGPAAATIAFVLGEEVRGPTVWDVLSATRAVCAALTAGDHHAIGSPVPLPPTDLRLVAVVLERAGEVVATAAGAANLGHPAAAIAALAHELAASGDPLRAGEVVVAAPLASVAETHPGDVLVASVAHIGTVEATVETTPAGAPLAG
jgi:2-oxo-3-hexenedioate decarboxylase